MNDRPFNIPSLLSNYQTMLIVVDVCRRSDLNHLFLLPSDHHRFRKMHSHFPYYIIPNSSRKVKVPSNTVKNGQKFTKTWSYFSKVLRLVNLSNISAIRTVIAINSRNKWHAMSEREIVTIHMNHSYWCVLDNLTACRVSIHRRFPRSCLR